MTDQFALFNEARRPWLDADVLKAKFLALSASVHPDRVHGETETRRQAAQEQFTALNAAYQCLSEPKTRLAHLLELERGAKPVNLQSIPADAMELSLAIGQVCREVDKFLGEQAGITSPLLKAQRFGLAMEWMDKLNALQQTILARRTALEAELKVINALWETAPPAGDADLRRKHLPLDRLEEIYRAFSFITRWSAQLQERVVQLTM